MNEPSAELSSTRIIRRARLIADHQSQALTTARVKLARANLQIMDAATVALVEAVAMESYRLGVETGADAVQPEYLTASAN